MYYGYPKVARNPLEMDPSRIASPTETNPVSERVLLPRYLCFLREQGEPAIVMNVEEYIAQYKTDTHISYVFVAYTGEQFQSSDDFRVLHQIADAAARNASVQAYWIGCSCMPDKNMLQEDVSF
jgi:hypothetical protein